MYAIMVCPEKLLLYVWCIYEGIASGPAGRPVGKQCVEFAK